MMILAQIFFLAQSVFAINHGTLVPKSSWMAKSVVNIYYYNGSIESYCTATVIARKYLLSAAHCFVNQEKNIMKLEYFRVLLGVDVNQARLGTPIKEDAVPHYKIKQVFVNHPVTKFSESGDIAIVELEKKLPRRYVPVSFAEAPKIPANLIIAGYGLDLTQAYHLNPIRMKWAELTTTKIPHHDEAFFTSENASLFMHAQAKNVAGNIISGCKGDSGGPAFILNVDGTYKQVGVFHGSTTIVAKPSLVPRCPADNLYYTNLTDYLSWITTIISKN